MSDEQPIGCARVSSSVAGEQAPDTAAPSMMSGQEEVTKMSVRVGQKAPDFTAPAYYRGGFTNVSLSDFAGKWVVLCFYPGDFTFV